MTSTEDMETNNVTLQGTIKEITLQDGSQEPKVLLASSIKLKNQYKRVEMETSLEELIPIILLSGETDQNVKNLKEGKRIIVSGQLAKAGVIASSIKIVDA